MASSLFPHLIAGPIQRPSHLLPQIQEERRFDARQFFHGLMLILSGLFRKCVIADNSALLANAAFSGQLGRTSFSLLIGIYAFAWQIYGDFSGYSDIARGSAQLLGFHFPLNFRQPYLAGSLREFWRRWHISLSSWLRDYLYIPLGGNRGPSRWRTYRNLFITMLLGGLWHGANWTFVAWGAIQGAGLSAERLLGQIFRGHPNLLWSWAGRLATLALVGIGWVFFRAPSFGQAVHMLGWLFQPHWRPAYIPAFGYLCALSLVALAIDWRLEFTNEEYVFESLHPRFALAVAFGMCAAITVFGAMESRAFLYFQF